MKKEDLKTGMRVVYANGEVGIVLADVDVIGLKDGGYVFISQHDHNLSQVEASTEDGWHVVEIYEGYVRNANVLDFDRKGALIWARQQQKSESEKQLDEISKDMENLKNKVETLRELIENKKEF